MGEEEVDRQQQQQYQRVTRWRANVTAMKERVRERFRVTSMPQRFFRQSQRLQLQPGAGVGWRATATGLVVARVFQDNTVLARVARSMAKSEWQRRMGKLVERFPSIRTLAASVTAGSAVAFAEPAQAEALALPSASYHLGPAIYDDHEVSITLKRQSSGQQAMILAPDPGTTITEEFGLFQDDSAFLKLIQAVAVPLIGNAAHVVMHGLNSTEVYGAEKMQRAVFQRSAGQPLITVSNHAAAVDDPFVISSVLPPHKLLNARNLRWTLCASEKCFSSPAVSAFFRSVKVLPLTKGHGVFQEGMDVALTKLNRGDWVHIFPEGGRSRDGELQLFKRGVGRLVLDAERLPIVLPFIHTGMNEVMPIGQKHFSTGRKITVLIGNPIYVDDLVKKHAKEGLSKAVLYDAITLRIEGTMWRMKKELDQLVTMREKCHTEDAHQDRETSTDRVQEIWQFVDWEAQGFLVDDFCRNRPKSAVVGPNVVRALVEEAQQSSSGSVAARVERFGGKCSHDATADQQGLVGYDELCFTDLYSGTLNRIHAGMDPTMFMGFAVRGLLVSSRAKLDNGLESLNRRYGKLMSGYPCS